MSVSELSKEHQDMILDGTKIQWYLERVKAWDRGEKIAPVTVDMALTQSCNYHCDYCYMKLQKQEEYHRIDKNHIKELFDDFAEIGVKGVSLVSDGESTISKHFVWAVQYGAQLGLSMANGSNAYLIKGEVIDNVLPFLTYLRVNITAGEPERYKEIMGVGEGYFEQVCSNIEEMVAKKRKHNWKCTIGMQMVLDPKYSDQILPLTKLAVKLGVDYLQIKHCSDDELGSLGVKYEDYDKITDLLKEAESYSNSTTLVKVKWSKITDKNIRSYQRCYGPPFLLQISGTGLVAPCGMLFNDRYSRYHMGNITTSRFKDIWNGEKYWSVIRELASAQFNAQTMCGSLCLQHSVNKYLDGYKKGEIKLVEPIGKPPEHLEFV